MSDDRPQITSSRVPAQDEVWLNKNRHAGLYEVAERVPSGGTIVCYVVLKITEQLAQCRIGIVRLLTYALGKRVFRIAFLRMIGRRRRVRSLAGPHNGDAMNCLGFRSL